MTALKRFASYIILTLFLIISLRTGVVVQAQSRQCVPDTTGFILNFRLSKWDLDPALGNNAAVLDSIGRLFNTIQNDSDYRLRNVLITGGASPEGPLKLNRTLSRRRAMSMSGHLDRYLRPDDDRRSVRILDRDWEGVLRLAEKDKAVPYRNETISLLKSIVEEKRLTGLEPERSLERMKALRGGEPYTYLLRNIFPTVRASGITISYDRILPPLLPADGLERLMTNIDWIIDVPLDTIVPVDTIAVSPEATSMPLYMDVRSNLLYDALALPNIGAEFYIGKNFSIGGNWMYAWWSKSSRNRFWRAYGGELFGRWWFGNAARRKPLTGHHIGLYGQAYIYDFEWEGDGQMGGKPGGSLYDKPLWGIGVEYGYSLPVSRRINIDFSVGIGYTTGYYHKYKPVDKTHYVWLSTSRRRLFGPTKAEISLVWLIGNDNYNRPSARKEVRDE